MLKKRHKFICYSGLEYKVGCKYMIYHCCRSIELETLISIKSYHYKFCLRASHLPIAFIFYFRPEHNGFSRHVASTINHNTRYNRLRFTAQATQRLLVCFGSPVLLFKTIYLPSEQQKHHKVYACFLVSFRNIVQLFKDILYTKVNNKNTQGYLV